MADRLQRALKAQDLAVSLVGTMREACLALAQQPHDLAIVPLYESGSLVRSLRALQPDLPVVLTSREAAAAIPDDQAGLVQALLPLDHLEQRLPAVLAGRGPSVDLAGPAEADAPTLIEAAPPAVDHAILEELCRQPAIAHGLQQVLFTAGFSVLAFCGPLGEDEALLVAERVGKTWSDGRHKVQVQYLRLPDFYDPLLLYSRPAVGCILTLVALPAMRVTDLRRQADYIVEQLVAHKLLANRESRPLAKPVNGLSPQSRLHSLIIAWRPVRPLPPPVQTVLVHHLRRLARDHSYELQYLQVESDLIHLVVTCPDDYPSGAVARLFKDGTEKAVQQQFGLPASLWKKGYYAAESREPLSTADLNVLLK
jgi:hypothetical protein